jgi:hypothetical protein
MCFHGAVSKSHATATGSSESLHRVAINYPQEEGDSINPVPRVFQSSDESIEFTMDSLEISDGGGIVTLTVIGYNIIVFEKLAKLGITEK